MQDPKQKRQEELYAMTEGVRTAAFLLVIPGCTVFGAGYGLLKDSLIPSSLMGLGAGLVVWGLIVALRKRETHWTA